VSQAHVTASLNDVARFSIRVAEALNGLRTRTLAGPPASEAVPDSAVRDAPNEDVPMRRTVALGAATTALVDVRHPSPMLGVLVLADLPLNLDWKVDVEAAWTVTSLAIEEGDTELEARVAWTRLGIAYRVLAGPAALDLGLKAGAALTWVTAQVELPDVARADVAASAVLSAGGAFSYPRDAPLHMYLALGATTFVPSIRFELPSGATSPFGELLGEAALGVRASW
jgi:hypothetical protein